MIRLVHQFDRPRARATVASPKSSACSCCCCCCVVTILTASALTARAVGRVPPPGWVPPPLPPPPVGEEPALPAPLQPRTSIGKRVLGFFMLPLAVVFGVLVATTLQPEAGAAAFVISYLAGLAVLRFTVGLGWVWILVLVLGIPLVGALEVMIRLSAAF